MGHGSMLRKVLGSMRPGGLDFPANAGRQHPGSHMLYFHDRVPWYAWRRLRIDCLVSSWRQKSRVIGIVMCLYRQVTARVYAPDGPGYAEVRKDFKEGVGRQRLL